MEAGLSDTTPNLLCWRPLIGERYWLVALLLLPLLLLYSPGLNYPLVFDDAKASVLDPDKMATMLEGGFIGFARFLSNGSFLWTFQWAGWLLPLMRLQNLLLHCANVVLLYFLLQSLFGAVLGSAGNASRHRWWAAVGALWFGCNPAAVYATAYLIERSMLMATGFSLLALSCTLRALQSESRRGRWTLAAAIGYVLALLSKEHAVLLPLVMIAIAALVSPDRMQWRHWRWPLLALVAAGAAFAFIQRTTIGKVYEGHALAMLAMQEVAGGRPLIEQVYPLSVVTQSGLFFKYLSLWLAPLPERMSIDMHPPLLLSLWGWESVSAMTAYAAWGVLGVALLRRRGPAGLAGVGLLWPWLLFGTELATVRVQEIFVVYRSYLWMAGLPLALPLLLQAVPQRLVRALLVALPIALLPLAWDRVYSFSNNFRLWDDAISKNDARPYALNGRAWMNRGVARMQSGDLTGGAADIEVAIALDPWFAEPYGNRGVIALRQGRLQDALRDTEYALAIDSGLEAFRKNRTLLLRLLEKQNAP